MTGEILFAIAVLLAVALELLYTAQYTGKYDLRENTEWPKPFMFGVLIWALFALLGILFTLVDGPFQHALTASPGRSWNYYFVAPMQRWLAELAFWFGLMAVIPVIGISVWIVQRLPGFMFDREPTHSEAREVFLTVQGRLLDWVLIAAIWGALFYSTIRAPTPRWAGLGAALGVGWLYSLMMYFIVDEEKEESGIADVSLSIVYGYVAVAFPWIAAYLDRETWVPMYWPYEALIRLFTDVAPYLYAIALAFFVIALYSLVKAVIVQLATQHA